MRFCMTNKLRVVLLAAPLLAIWGCGGPANLKPAPRANEVVGMDDAATATRARVKVIAQADGWPGPALIRESVTPMRVVIENNSDKPVLVRYPEFSLVSASGKRHAALPPFRIDDTVAVPTLAPGYAPFRNVGFTYSRYSVAPMYSSVYPGIGAYPGWVGYDPFYYSMYYDHWTRTQLPTTEMLERALPEGVLQPGGRVSGFLYFEKVPADSGRAQFRAEIVDARNGNQIATITIPFVVEET